MAKKKKIADNFHKNKTTAVKLNPFEVHVNREKFKVLGRQVKNDKGLPGISRAKGIKKRKQTLLQEYKSHTKANLFKDKRIDAKDESMTPEEKATARFASIRMKTSKQSIYNLGDDDVLTHENHTVSEVEKFESRLSDDEKYSEDEDKSDKNAVESTYFSDGFLKSKGTAKTHSELISQIILESKKRKDERQKLKEQIDDHTQKLDSEFKDFLPFFNLNSREKQNKPPVDDFHKSIALLKFEPKGSVTDKLKTEEEIAKEEKERLEQLEKERLERMKGTFEDKKQNHRSVDELDDDFIYESDHEQEQILSYNETGKSNVDINAYLNGKEINVNENVSEKSDSEDNNEEEIENDDSEEDEEGKLSEADDESEDDFSDLKAAESESEDEQMDENKSSEKTSNKTKYQEKIKEDLLKRKEIMDKAREELPYLFPFPEKYEDLQLLLEKKPTSHIGIILERLIKANHPSLAEENKSKLNYLFVFLLQYLNDTAADAKEDATIKLCFEVFSEIMPHLYDLANFDKLNTYKCMSNLIKEKFDAYRKRPKKYPGLENLIFLKIVSLLFTTSDFRHKIVTPSFIFIDQMLTKCKVKTRRDISYGLFLVSLVLEYTTLSKRYLPSAIIFLGGLLHMTIPKTGIKIIKVSPPFNNLASYLVVQDKELDKDADLLKMDCSDLSEKLEIDVDFKLRIIYTTLKLLNEFNTNFKEYPSNVEIFEPILKYLELIPKENYIDSVKKEFDFVTELLIKNKTERRLQYIRLTQKPKTLKLLEPVFEEVFDRKSYKAKSAEEANISKLRHKVKKEHKSALREVRKDQAFLSRVRIHQQIKSDKERQDKVKRLFSEAASQQSELNSLQRAKKRK